MTSVNGREEIEANVRLLFQNFFQKISQLDFLKLAASLLPSLRRVIAREEGGGGGRRIETTREASSLSSLEAVLVS